LRQAGARESTVFSARLSNYNAFLVSLTGPAYFSIERPGVHLDEGIVSRLDDQPVVLFALAQVLLGLLPLGDVEHHAAHADRRARFMVQSEIARRMSLSAIAEALGVSESTSS